MMMIRMSIAMFIITMCFFFYVSCQVIDPSLTIISTLS